MVILAALVGCMTVARTKGAKPLEKGQWELALGAPSVRSHEDPELTFPVPQGGLELRAGVGPDTDLGLQMYTFGVGIDLRHRFFHRGKWHGAVAPGFGAIVLPNLLAPEDVGGFEGKLPLLFEHETLPWLSLSGGPQLVMRERANLTVDGVVWRFDLWTTAGLRAEAHGGIFAVGVSADVAYLPTRYTARPGWVLGADFRFRSRTRTEANARARRKGKPPKWPEVE